MRHGRSLRRLNRTKAHRTALLRNLAQSLFEHGEIRTTVPKARELQPFAERLITLAIQGDLHARQRATALLTDRSIIPADRRAEYDAMSDAQRERVLRFRSGRRHRRSTTRPGAPFTAESVIYKLFSQIGPAMKDRNDKKECAGGYTRLIKLARRRLGDGAFEALVQIVSADDAPRKSIGEKTQRRRRARVKYDFYAGKPLNRGRRASREKPAKPAPAEKASEPASE